MSGSGSGSSRNPELQRLLAALNSYAPQAQPVTASPDISQAQPQQLQLQQLQLQQQQPYGSGQNNHSFSLNLTPLNSRKRPHESETSSHQWQSAAPTVAAATSNIPGLGMVSASASTPPAPVVALPAPAPTLALAPLSASLSTSASIRATTTAAAAAAAATRTTTPTIPDASSITTYPAALKHVTRHLATSETVSTRIRHLINTQHQHERQWHMGREALIAQQESRRSTSAQVSALLQSLGGKDTSTLSTMSATETAAANEAELQAYDAKVYRSLVAMQADFDRQLRNLGVPFFAISHDLVLKDGERIGTGIRGGNGSGLEDDNYFKNTKLKLDKGELRELQKRMVSLLEDLFGD